MLGVGAPSSEKTDDIIEDRSTSSVGADEKQIELFHKDMCMPKVATDIGPQLKEALREKLNSIKRKSSISIPVFVAEIPDKVRPIKVTKTGGPAENRSMIDKTPQLVTKVASSAIHKQNINRSVACKEFQKLKKDGKEKLNRTNLMIYQELPKLRLMVRLQNLWIRMVPNLIKKIILYRDGLHARCRCRFEWHAIVRTLVWTHESWYLRCTIVMVNYNTYIHVQLIICHVIHT